jgi:hypothetical protein
MWNPGENILYQRPMLLKPTELVLNKIISHLVFTHLILLPAVQGLLLVAQAFFFRQPKAPFCCQSKASICRQPKASGSWQPKLSLC